MTGVAYRAGVIRQTTAYRHVDASNGTGGPAAGHRVGRRAQRETRIADRARVARGPVIATAASSAVVRMVHNGLGRAAMTLGQPRSSATIRVRS
jgi:hypothetical protein